MGLHEDIREQGPATRRPGESLGDDAAPKAWPKGESPGGPGRVVPLRDEVLPDEYLAIEEDGPEPESAPLIRAGAREDAEKIARLTREIEKLRHRAEAEGEAARRKIVYLEEMRATILADARKTEKERDELNEKLERMRSKYDATEKQRKDLLRSRYGAAGAGYAPGMGTTPPANSFEKTRLIMNKTHKENWGHGGDWLLSYGDFMTLLLCVFIMLFSLASSEDLSLRTVTNDIAKTFSGMRPSGMVTKENTETGVRDLPGTETSMARTRELDAERTEIITTGISRSPVIETSLKKPDELDTLRREIFRTFEDYDLGESLLVSVRDKGVEITLRNGITFVEGGTELLDSSRRILDHLAAIVSANRGFDVVVEGHTDDQPIRSSRYPSNWELSTARATNVVRYFTEVSGLPEERFTAAGYGEHRPVGDNGTEAGRAANRRVVIKLVNRK